MSVEIDGTVTPLPLDPNTIEGGMTRFELLGNSATCTADTLTFVNPNGQVPPIVLDRA